MRVVIVPDADSVSQFSASLIADVIRMRPQCTLGLATGSTPLGTYRELIRLHQQSGLDFSGITTFNLDEYVGIQADDPRSYRSFMNQELFSHVNVDPARTHLPGTSGSGADHWQEECDQYEQAIADAGGLDLQLLGIGTDGHIGFNEPGSSLASRTRVKTLTAQTRQDNARFFASLDQVPRMAITMGIGTILSARQILLLATGANKAQAIRSCVEGPITAMVPASALQWHPRVTVILDHQAAGLLAQRAYYEECERLRRQSHHMTMSSSLLRS